MISYIAHCQRLTERKRLMAPRLEAFALNAVWVEDFDPPEIPESIWLERVVNGRLSEGEVSAYLKHEQIYRAIAQSNDGPLALSPPKKSAHRQLERNFVTQNSQIV